VITLLHYQLEARRECDPVDAENTIAMLEEKIRRAQVSSVQLSTYFVGWQQILKLRGDYKREHGADFSLQEFHDRLLANGNAPLWVHRQMLLPGDKGKLID